MQAGYTGSRLNLFYWLGDSWWAVSGVMAAYLTASFGLMIGWRPRWMAAVIFLCLVSFTHRNPLAFTSGDTLLRLMAFFLIFTPSAAAWAVRPEGRTSGLISPLGFRLMQFQVCLVYFAGFLAKLQGPMWRDGTAVYVVQQLTEFSRFPVPAFFHNELASKVLTWGTLGLEGLFPFLVFFGPTRPFILGAAALFHLGLEYSMNIQLFELTMLACLVLFLRGEELTRALARLRALCPGFSRN